MSSATMFNSLIRQLLIQLGDEAGTNLIVNALNTEKKVNVLRTLAFSDKTITQIHNATGISENYLYYVTQKLIKLGLVEVKRTIPNSTPEKGGSEKKVWGLV